MSNTTSTVDGTSPQHNVIRILGINVHALTLQELLAAIEHIACTRQHAIIAHINIHGANLAYKLPWFRAFLNQSQIVFCDGFGIKWGAQLLGYRIPERITYADWTWQFASFAEQHGLTVFFLGSRPGVAEKAVTRLQAQYPNLQIVGIHHGYFNKHATSQENEAVIQAINAVKPHVLIVGMSMPTQERWLLENWERIEANVALPAGAVFDYVSGRLQRGPHWMTNHGLEWLARLIIEPRRLWYRYIIGNPLFLWRVFKQSIGLAHFDNDSNAR